MRNATTHTTNPLNAFSLYRFHFNGQEADNEVAGTGNSYTAEFWQYDSRLGRRWNVDPKPNPSISIYACFANNPIFFADPYGDSIEVDNTITENVKLNTAFNLFATTKEGQKFLAQYAAKGQTIAGVTYKKDGKYHKKGVNLNYSATDLPGTRRGETQTVVDGKGATVFVTIDNQFTSKTTKGLVAEMMGKSITIFHESFIHADLDTKDYLDNGKVDDSNIPKTVKNAANGFSHHYQHYKVLMDYKSGNGSQNLWPTNAFLGIQEINNKIKMKVFNSDKDIENEMWNYSGGR